MARWFLLLLMAVPAFGARKVVAPAYEFRTNGSFSPSPPASPREVGFNMRLSLTISNVSNLAQSGFVRLRRGSSGYGRCLSPAGTLPLHNFLANFYNMASATVCASTGFLSANSSHEQITSRDLDTPIYIAPNDVFRMQVGAWFRGYMPYSNTSQGCDNFDGLLNIFLEIEMTDDRGAVIASVSPMFDIAGCGAPILCGIDVNPLCGTPLVQHTTLTSVPVLINGGRPF